MTITVRIATRQSPLALWQANHVRDRLLAAHPSIAVELVTMRTQGDRWLEAPLSEVGGKGLFIKELEQAMLDGRADLAVHSMKDMPAALPDGFELAAIGSRDNVQDVLVGTADGLAGLPAGARIGSSSLRRQAQLLALRPDLHVAPVRGNVQTRLDKQRSGEFFAIVLARAGLNRLQLTPVSTDLSLDDCLPAAGQGALGIECRAGDERIAELVGCLNDDSVARCVIAERQVSLGLGADCSMPVAAYAVMESDHRIWLRALLASADGTQMIRAQAFGADPVRVGEQVVGELFSRGAADILDKLHAGR